MGTKYVCCCDCGIDHTRHCRMHIVRVLPASWLDEHREVIADVVPPPCPSFSPPPSPLPPAPTATTSVQESPIAYHLNSVVEKHIHMLPSEVMLLIFSFCSWQELDKIVPRVCRRWHKITEHASLRRRLLLKEDDGISTAAACQKLISSTKMVELSITGRCDVIPIMRQAVESTPTLRKLTIRRMKTFPGKEAYCELLKSLLLKTDLREISIKKCTMRMLYRPFFTPLQVHLANVRKINFNYIPDLCRDDLCRIVSSCPRLRDFRVLVLNSTITNALLFSDLDMMVIVALADTLEVLKIDAHNVSDVGMAVLASCRKMRKLHLGCLRRVSDQGLQNLLDFQELESLTLTNVNAATSVGWAHLTLERFWPRMRRLTLVKCSFDDAAANNVAQNYTQIRSLNIGGCKKLTKQGIQRMVVSLPALEDITLCLSQTGGCIYWIPASAPSIKTIAYHSCSYPSGSHLELYEPFEDFEKMGETNYFAARKLIVMGSKESQEDSK